MPHSLVHDSQNNLIILGSSGSSNYPTTFGAYDQTFNTGWTQYTNMWGNQYTVGCDIVITKLNAIGNILNSTFIGGTDNEGINESLVFTAIKEEAKSL